MRWSGTDASALAYSQRLLVSQTEDTSLQEKKIKLGAGYGVYKVLRCDRHHPTPPNRVLPPIAGATVCHKNIRYISHVLPRIRIFNNGNTLC